MVLVKEIIDYYSDFHGEKLCMDSCSPQKRP